jgi:crotonobetainyl-CoA:carnitine CoA-transferase CaiB-like acyl-CoA transferase
MSGPLTGVRIVMMGGVGPAPFCGMLLGDLGADVIRVDPVAGVNGPLPIDYTVRRSQRSLHALLRGMGFDAEAITVLEDAGVVAQSSSH